MKIQSKQAMCAYCSKNHKCICEFDDRRTKGRKFKDCPAVDPPGMTFEQCMRSIMIIGSTVMLLVLWINPIAAAINSFIYGAIVLNLIRLLTIRLKFIQKFGEHPEVPWNMYTDIPKEDKNDGQ
jgi:hypothetical protein